MKFPFLSNSKSLDPNISSSQPWPWPSCTNIKTLSFRASDPKETAFSTYNSAFLDTEITTPDCFFTFSSSSLSDSTIISDDLNDPVENAIQGLKSDRLFFDPEQSSSLISSTSELNDEEIYSKVEEEENNKEFKESEILSMESNNPFDDFRKSMEEMVEAHGLKDWQGLEELLGCYLKINGQQNHGFIVGAFIDLLVSFSFASFTNSSSSSSLTTSSSSSLTTSSSISSPSSLLSLPPCLSTILDDDDDGNDVHVDHHVKS